MASQSPIPSNEINFIESEQTLQEVSALDDDVIKDSKKTTTPSPILAKSDSTAGAATLACNLPWIPGTFRTSVMMSSFVAAIAISLYAQRNADLVYKNPQLLVLIPIIISFSGSVATNAVQRTLMVWSEECFKAQGTRLIWTLKLSMQGILIGLGVSVLAMIIFHLMHFSPKVVTILGITLPVIMLSATVVGIAASIILMAFFERHRPYIGNIVLPINDFLNTLIYLRIARLML